MAAKKRTGFSLVELMIVIVIIGIIAGIALPMYLDYVRKSRVAEVPGILKTIVLTQSGYKAQPTNAEYAATIGLLGWKTELGTSGATPSDCEGGGTRISDASYIWACGKYFAFGAANAECSLTVAGTSGLSYGAPINADDVPSDWQTGACMGALFELLHK